MQILLRQDSIVRARTKFFLKTVLQPIWKQFGLGVLGVQAAAAQRLIPIIGKRLTAHAVPLVAAVHKLSHRYVNVMTERLLRIAIVYQNPHLPEAVIHKLAVAVVAEAVAVHHQRLSTDNVDHPMVQA